MKFLLDTNIMIDYLNGIAKSRKWIEDHSDIAISIITWMEVLCGATNEEEALKLRLYLQRFTIIELTVEIASQAVSCRKKYKLKLPDAIIYATALEMNRTLITRNEKDFKASLANVHVPYKT